MRSKEGRGWITINEAKSIVSRYGIALGAEFEELLELFHELGVIIHLTNTSILREIIVTKPQWLMIALCKIIRDDSQHGFDIGAVTDAGLLSDVNTLIESGLASIDLLEFVWKKREVHFLLDLMRTTLLMSDWHFGEERLYLIPSMLKSSTQARRGGHTSLLQNKADCLFDFSETFCPYGLFERLICLCVAHSGRMRTTKAPKLTNSLATGML